MCLIVLTGAFGGAILARERSIAQTRTDAEAHRSLAFELARLQAALEYLMRRGDLDAAGREIAVLASNADVSHALLVDSTGAVQAATRRAWLRQPAARIVPMYEDAQAEAAISLRRNRIVTQGPFLIGYAGIQVVAGGAADNPVAWAKVMIALDVSRRRAQTLQDIQRQALAVAGMTMAMGLALWWVLHSLLTRRVRRLVAASDRLAQGDLETRSGLGGWDELATLGRAFDAMARQLGRDRAAAEEAALRLAAQRAELHRQEKLAALGALTAGVAHELKNPLTAVITRAAQLEESEHPATRASARKLITYTQRCARIVEDFLSMAQAAPPVRERTHLNDLVREVLALNEERWCTASIEVSARLAPDLPAVHADARQCRQIIDNLITNAFQALDAWPGPRQLDVETRHNATLGEVLLSVRDSGPGIPPDRRARVFEPFFTTRREQGGTGLGLAVSRALANAQGGMLLFDCPIGSGCEFTLRLQCAHTGA